MQYGVPLEIDGRLRTRGNEHWADGVVANANESIFPRGRNYMDSSIVRSLEPWSYGTLKPASLRALIGKIDGVQRCLDGC